MQLNNMRYFLVMYSIRSEGSNGEGLARYTTDDGEYANNKKVRESMAKANSCKENNICITNIIELNESDYNDFIK